MLNVIKVKDGKRKMLKFKLTPFERRIIVREVYELQNYFPRINTEQDFTIKEKDTVIDIGANVGLFSVCAANLAKKGKVYAFEPVKENFERLTYHTRLNGLHNATLVNKGVSNKNKKVRIYLAEENTGGHSTNKNKFKYLHELVRATEMVDCVTLKSIFDKYKIRRCDFLKLDCEGEESNILTALPARYFKRIEKISLEFHHPVVDELKLASYLKKQDFRVTISNFGSTLGMIFAYKRK